MGNRGRHSWIIFAIVAVPFMSLFVVIVVVKPGQQEASKPPRGVEEFDVGGAGKHTLGVIDYEQNPPVGGPHNPVWQNCGFYDKPVRNENATHSMEHGAVWITYQADLPSDQVEVLRNLAHDNTYVLATPYIDLPTPVVASAWGKQLQLESANDPRLVQFVSAFREGPQTPEPGRPCIGGTGVPS